ncbi:serine acetyltransferase [Kocuria rosea]|uniref:serine O-acetyltransferase EpsC n=1 Tax=Kocuria rosea TaxID=1275 RepID=UPI000D65110B|nr:serine O-acetyltransferase EpsC [Kocuria rosea]MEB2528532.1 serine O-acetyltransferase EpsC [Kocuria rosea]MEB2619376.1 serine O-acetyltransferase EpsC [Kocuria rosea]PWF81554.1 serine acetyltransferase [Kocuria rosea]QCY31758.1 serine acetyltransferase [Kocuria rosea]TQN39181.1 serine O-acetyltransferase [Kocuria rosea]
MAEPTRPSVLADARAIAAADPAGQGTVATLLSYPGLHAVAAHRIAHRLWSTRWSRPAAQAIATAAAKVTGITIHPGAVIGHRLFIDHGSEVIIGETSVIGDDVTIYQGASFVGDGSPGRRHAVVGDRALLGSGAKVIGPVTLGAGSKIGAGAVVTHDVEADTTVLGINE